MAPETTSVQDDVEQLRRRFEEFRSGRTSRGRLPEALWKEAVGLAKRYGLNPTARALRLDYTGLRKRMDARDHAKPKGKEPSASAFVELVGPVTGPLTSCSVEVESLQGSKLRFELKNIGTGELANLIRAFVGH
jgi:hypothetical protein